MSSTILIHPAVGKAGSPSNTKLPGPRPTCMPSFILIRQNVWPQYTNVRDRQDRQDNRLIAYGEPFYKRSPNQFHLRCTRFAEKSIISKHHFIFLALQGGHKVGEKNSRSFSGFLRAIIILFQRLPQQKTRNNNLHISRVIPHQLLLI